MEYIFWGKWKVLKLDQDSEKFCITDADVLLQHRLFIDDSNNTSCLKSEVILPNYF